jgi:hypothetical protein
MLCLGLTFTTARAAGLECPLLNNRNVPQLAQEVIERLPKGMSLEQIDRLSSAITLMREHGLSIDDTIDRLIALYCPAVSAEPGLTHNQRLNRVRLFAERARRMVIGGRNVEDVIYDVPLSPGVAEAAALRARKSGTTVEKWIARTIEAAIRHGAPPIAVEE